jgi:uncharacterized protein (TIGR03437 family)
MNYVPGVAQTLTVTVADPVEQRWGFQLTARVHGNAQTQAGSFTPGSDGFTQLSCGVLPFGNGSFSSQNIDYQNSSPQCASNTAKWPLQYIEHTSAGTRPGATGSVTFTFQWTPPGTNVGSIDIYVAGAAANGDGAATGDHIYLTSYTLAASSAGPFPQISSNGVVNAAGFQQTIAPGSWVAIFGTNLSLTTRIWQSSDFTNNGQQEPTQLDGVSVVLGGYPAFVYYISPTQINVQASPSINSGTTTVHVSNANGASAPVTATVANVVPAFFQWSGNNKIYAVATRTDFSWVGPPGLFTTGTTTPAKPGDTIILWGTGFGATTPAMSPGQLTPTSGGTVKVNDPVTVTVGGLNANYLSGALTPGEAGVYQIAIQIPSNAPNGDLPVLATIDNVTTPTGVFITVQQ